MPALTRYENEQAQDALSRRQRIVKESERAGQWERAAVQRAETDALADSLDRLAADEEDTLP